MKQYTVVEKMLESKRAAVDSVDKEGCTPLHCACKNGDLNMIEILLKGGTNIDQKDSSGKTPLHHACEKGHLIAVELLLENKASVDLADENGASPLHFACGLGHDAIVKILLKNNANKDDIDLIGQTPLHQACMGNHLSTIELLYSEGASLLEIDINEKLPLEYLNSDDARTIISKLSETDKEFFNNTIFSRTDVDPVVLFKKWAHRADSQELAKRIWATCSFEKRGLFFTWLAQEKDVELLKFIISGMDDIDSLDEDNQSLLHCVVVAGTPEMVDVLIANHARIDLQDKNLNTPLHLAVLYNKEAMANCLLDHNATVDLLNKDHFTPLVVALAFRNNSIANLLEKHQPHGANRKLADEILLRKTLGHGTGMEGTTKIELPNESIELTLTSFFQTYAMQSQSDELANFLSKHKDDPDIASIPEEERKELIEVLNEAVTPDPFSGAKLQDIESQAEKGVQNIRKEKKPVIILGGWKRHAITILIDEDENGGGEIRVINRGGGCFMTKDGRVYTPIYKYPPNLSDEELKELIIKFAKKHSDEIEFQLMVNEQCDPSKGGKLALTNAALSETTLEDRETSQEITHKPQGVGNCSVASAKAGILHLLIKYYGRDLGLKIYKRFSSEFRKNAPQKYDDAHPDKNDPLYSSEFSKQLRQQSEKYHAGKKRGKTRNEKNILTILLFSFSLTI